MIFVERKVLFKTALNHSLSGVIVGFNLCRFAGSQEKAAFETLHHYVQFFLSLAKKNERNRSLRPLEVSKRSTFV